jgi:hypothetical protein
MAFLGLGLLALVFGLIAYKLIKILPSSDEKELVEVNNFIIGKPLIKDMNGNKGISIIESLPILVVILMFFYWHFKYLFI